MAQKTRVELNISKFTQKLWETCVLEQNRRLVEYAKITTQEIGDRIREYNSRNHMDRTGNLLDSLCWCVSYRGQIVETGYYQNRATRLSHLHEFSPEWEAYPVGGHVLADKYIQQYGGTFSNGWRIFFTIRAPYWGYWEKGFVFKRHGKPIGFRQFSVMTQYFDKVTKDLTPAKVTFRNKVPVYTSYVRSYRFKTGRKTKSGKDIYTTSTHYGSLQTRSKRYQTDWKPYFKNYSSKRYKS